METRASYITVGSFVLALIAGLVLFVVWLGRISFEEPGDRYLIYFTGSVTGLQQGSTVQVRGIPVGQVVDLGFDSTDIGQIRVMIEVQPDTPIRQDSVATLATQGIAGVPFVQITGGSADAAPLVASGGQEYPVIESRPSTLQAVLETFPATMQQFADVMDRINELMSDENQQMIARTLTNVQDLTASLADSVEHADALIVNADGMVEELRIDMARISDDLDRTLATVEEGVAQASADFSATTQEYRELAQTFGHAAEQLDAVITAARPGLTEFSQTGLVEFTIMVAELRSLANTLARVAERIERDPRTFLFGTTNQGVPTQ